MTYNSSELSNQDGAPIELYAFQGTYGNYYMTSDAVPHTLGSTVFVPVPGLKRSRLVVGATSGDVEDLTVDIPVYTQIAKENALQDTPPALTMTIWRMHRGATDAIAYWRGPVATWSVKGKTATARIPSKFGAMVQGTFPSVFIQPPCNNQLFDTFCKVLRSEHSIDTTVAGVENGGKTVTLATIGAFPDKWFIGGEIAVAVRNERRTIVNQVGTILYINYPFMRLPLGTGVQVTAGCDHSFRGPNGCPKFANQKNYGGMPFVPGESNNPFTVGLH